jgi:hypothetical protein
MILCRDQSAEDVTKRLENQRVKTSSIDYGMKGWDAVNRNLVASDQQKQTLNNLNRLCFLGIGPEGGEALSSSLGNWFGPPRASAVSALDHPDPVWAISAGLFWWYPERARKDEENEPNLSFLAQTV